MFSRQIQCLYHDWFCYDCHHDFGDMFCDLVAFSLECCHRPECPIIQSCLSYIVIVALGTTTYIPLHQGHNLLKDRQNSAAKNQASDWLTWPSWSTNLRLGFGGKQLELMPCLQISEKPTFWKMFLYWNISTYFQILCHTLSHLFLSLWTWTDLVISTYTTYVRQLDQDWSWNEQTFF